MTSGSRKLDSNYVSDLLSKFIKSSDDVLSVNAAFKEYATRYTIDVLKTHETCQTMHFHVIVMPPKLSLRCFSSFFKNVDLFEKLDNYGTFLKRYNRIQICRFF